MASSTLTSSMDGIGYPDCLASSEALSTISFRALLSDAAAMILSASLALYYTCICNSLRDYSVFFNLFNSNKKIYYCCRSFCCISSSFIFRFWSSSSTCL